MAASITTEWADGIAYLHPLVTFATKGFCRISREGVVSKREQTESRDGSAPSALLRRV